MHDNVLLYLFRIILFLIFVFVLTLQLARVSVELTY